MLTRRERKLGESLAGSCGWKGATESGWVWLGLGWAWLGWARARLVAKHPSLVGGTATTCTTLYPPPSTYPPVHVTTAAVPHTPIHLYTCQSAVSGPVSFWPGLSQWQAGPGLSQWQPARLKSVVGRARLKSLIPIRAGLCLKIRT